MYLWLKAEENVEILKCQDRVLLSRAEIDYRPDFKCQNKKTGAIYHVEAKGFETPEWRLKRKLWMFYGPGPLQVFKGSGTRFKLAETIVPRLPEDE